MRNRKLLKYYNYIFLLFLCQSSLAQSIHQEKIKPLGILVGEWIGTAKTYKNGVLTEEEPAFERISYDLDTSILVIELNRANLLLHTIVSYDEEDEVYYYNRFSKKGASRYPAEFIGGQLVVARDENTKIYFGRTPDGGFQEYGERLIDGEWIRFFDETYTNTQ